MSRWLEEGEYNDALRARLRGLRGELTQQEMANALKVPLDRYKKYETRSPIPAYLIPRLAEQTGSSVHYIVTGMEQPIQADKRPAINEYALARLLYSLGPALPSDGMTERAAQALTVALKRGLELLPDEPSSRPSDAAFVQAARAAMSQFHEALQP